MGDKLHRREGNSPDHQLRPLKKEKQEEEARKIKEKAEYEARIAKEKELEKARLAIERQENEARIAREKAAEEARQDGVCVVAWPALKLNP